MMYGHSIGGLNKSSLVSYSDTVTNIKTDNPKCNIYKDAVKKLNIAGHIPNGEVKHSWNDAFGTICGRYP